MKSLFYENGKLSLGRAMLWIFTILIISFYYIIVFTKSDFKDLPPSMVEIFISLLLYNCFKKGRDVAKEYLTSKKDKPEENQ